jgi:hypothetical protein
MGTPERFDVYRLLDRSGVCLICAQVCNLLAMYNVLFYSGKVRVPTSRRRPGMSRGAQFRDVSGGTIRGLIGGGTIRPYAAMTGYGSKCMGTPPQLVHGWSPCCRRPRRRQPGHRKCNTWFSLGPAICQTGRKDLIAACIGGAQLDSLGLSGID